MSLRDNQYLCDSNDSVLVIIDIQPKLTATVPMKVLARLQKNSALLLKAANRLNVPVIASEQYPNGLGKIENEILKLMPESSICIEKTSFSCAGNDAFIQALESSGRRQVILLGMEAHICVYQTAVDLLRMDYAVFVAIDGICSRQRESYETALLRLRQAGAVICDTESILFEWMRGSDHLDFKSIASMLK